MRMRNMGSPTDGDLPPEGHPSASDYAAHEYSHSYPRRWDDGRGSRSHAHDANGAAAAAGRALLHRCPFSNCCHTATHSHHAYAPPSTMTPSPAAHTYHHFHHYRPHSLPASSSAPAALAPSASTCYRLRSPLESRAAPSPAVLSKENIKLAASRLLRQGFPKEALTATQHSQCQEAIRKAAVECMLAELNIFAKTNSTIITEIQTSLKRLESQVYNEANSMQEYFFMIATKLAEVFHELQKARTTRSAHVGMGAAPHPRMPGDGGALVHPPPGEEEEEEEEEELAPGTPSAPSEAVYVCKQELRRHHDAVPPTLT